MASMTRAEQEQASKDRARQRLLRRAYRLADRESRQNKDPRAAMDALKILDIGEQEGLQVQGITSTEKEVAGHKARLTENQRSGRDKLNAMRDEQTIYRAEQAGRLREAANMGVPAPTTAATAPVTAPTQATATAPTGGKLVAGFQSQLPSDVPSTPESRNIGGTSTPAINTATSQQPVAVAPRLAASPVTPGRGTINGRPTEEVLGPRPTGSSINGMPVEQWRAGRMERAARLNRATPTPLGAPVMDETINAANNSIASAENAIERGYGALGRIDQSMSRLNTRPTIKDLIAAMDGKDGKKKLAQK